MASTFSSASGSYNRPNTRSQRKRLDPEKMQQLRETSNNKHCAITRMSAVFKENVKNTLAAMFAPKVQKVNAMCKYYGHIIDPQWKGHTPKCTDCGTPVTSPDMLRKSAPNAAVMPAVTR